jgi:hypothetical protein
MSAKQRKEAEAARAKYARVYEVPIEDVRIVYLEDEDAAIGVQGLPTWTLGASDPKRATETYERMKAGVGPNGERGIQKL